MTQFEFVVSGGKPERVTAAVRSHAVKSGLQRRCTKDKAKIVGSQYSENTINQKSSLKGRFRIVETAKKPSQRKKAASQRASPCDCDGSSTSSGSAGGSPPTEVSEIQTVAGQLEQLPSEKNPTDVAISRRHQMIRNMPTHDPFSATSGYNLPAKESLDALMVYFVRSFADNVTVEEMQKYWWGLSISDPTVIHTALGTAASLWSHCGPNPKVALREASRQRALALRGIREKLRQNEISNELVGAIANLASMEGIAGDFDAAMVHLKGVQNLMNSRGGIEAMKRDEDVCLAINWSDLITAAGLGTRPLMPFLYPFESLKMPSTILLYAEKPSLGHLMKLECSPFDSSIRHVFLMIRQAHYGVINKALPVKELRHFINGTEYILSNVLANNENGTLTKPLLMAAYLFLQTCVRLFNPECVMLGSWRSRICASFSYPHRIEFVIENNDCRDGLCAILWCIVLASATCTPENDEMIFTFDTISKLTQALNIQDTEEIKLICQQFLWDDDMMGGYLKTIKHRFST